MGTFPMISENYPFFLWVIKSLSPQFESLGILFVDMTIRDLGVAAKGAKGYENHRYEATGCAGFLVGAVINMHTSCPDSVRL
jgi:hypothetical protein